MKKGIIAILVLTAIVIGAVFVTANLTENTPELEETDSSNPACYNGACNGDCGGSCGVPTCGCGR
ncbi:hypothetical protein HN592_00635 [Candidatus Woesearchaeota archaeon]|jgi:hypothetical protein|nr:hypothetical protein [Candidatus Woesearchaeota archaeon]MBT4368810.1 hypothetical protein [Candidatus Woesearchaeota archaeon]MBT4712099.1 hypothetical protein [Candidatus Woesearchaeota archaeon]MBT6639153.1 hypothetical protein [Candidatus Woesearchaeota archaeon]MBT7134353.1 hypothetical protein [Candidatus Woesearchaeota archaeon]